MKPNINTPPKSNWVSQRSREKSMLDPFCDAVFFFFLAINIFWPFGLGWAGLLFFLSGVG